MRVQTKQINNEKLLQMNRDQQRLSSFVKLMLETEIEFFTRQNGGKVTAAVAQYNLILKNHFVLDDKGQQTFEQLQPEKEGDPAPQGKAIMQEGKTLEQFNELMQKFHLEVVTINTKGRHLLEAVESILWQDDGHEHRILLLDDGSDNLDTIIALDFLKTLSKNIEVHGSRENKGTSAILNYGHSLVETEYVAIMGSDDISHPARFRLQIQYLKANKGVDVLGTNLFSFYEDDIFKVISSPVCFCSPQSIRKNPLKGLTVHRGG